MLAVCASSERESMMFGLKDGGASLTCRVCKLSVKMQRLYRYCVDETFRTRFQGKGGVPMTLLRALYQGRDRRFCKLCLPICGAVGRKGGVVRDSTNCAQTGSFSLSNAAI